MARVAVLGATGFVGGNACDALHGHTVYPLSMDDGFDMLDGQSVYQALSDIKPDYVINCAAMTGSIKMVSDRPADMLNANTRMILNLYNAMLYTPNTTIINPIANCVYPGDMSVLCENNLFMGDVHHSVMGYASTRRLLLHMAECYWIQYRINTINLITPNMYGPGDSTDPAKTHALNAMIIKFVRAKRNEEKSVEIWGTGKPIREWLYVKDFARFVAELVDNEVRAKSYAPLNIAQNTGYSIRHLAEMVASITGYTRDVYYNDAYQDGAASKIMDDTRFRYVFGDFAFTGIHDGIRETIKYYEAAL